MAELRAVSFNIRHGQGLDGLTDLFRVAAALRGLFPDIIGLQELDADADRSGGIDQAAWLGDALGMRVTSAAARGRRPHERVALLSRFPMSQLRDVWFWTGHVRGEARGAAIAQVTAPMGSVSCAVAHLSTRRWERVLERRALAAMMSRLPGPALLFLDANGPGLRPLERHGLLPPPGHPVNTFPANRPATPVDWVLARAPARHLREAQADPCEASDHLPVLAVIAGNPE